MAKTDTIQQYQEMIRKALRNAGRYSESLELQIYTLASTLLTLSIVTSDISKLKKGERWCGDTRKVHPAFNVQRYAWDSVTRQLKALGLHTEQLGAEVEGDPLAELTQQLIDVGRDNGEIVRPDMEAGDE